MTADELLEQLEPLTHAERVQRMIALGRQQDDESRAVLAEMERGGFFARFLALYACFGSRDSAHAVRALSDPSRTIRGLALRLVPQVCDEPQLTAILFSAPKQVRRALLWKLAGRKHQASRDAFIEQLAGRGDEQQVYEFLAFGSPTLVQRHIGRFRQQARPADWVGLVQFHPAEAMAQLQQWANDAGPDDKSFSQQVRSLLPLLAKPEPVALLALVKTLLQRKLLASMNLNLNPLAAQRPGALADLVLQTNTALAVNFTTLVGKLTSAQIIALYERGKLPRYPSWFKHVARAQRVAVFTALERRFRAASSYLFEVAEALPSELGAGEARKALARSNQPLTQRLPFAQLLPWEEVLPALNSSLHASEVPARQAALHALIGALPRHRERLPDVLDILLTRRSEQDPVRLTMLEALSKLPFTIWREEHLSALEQIARHALNDVGLSSRTQQALLSVLLKLLPVFPDWATNQILTVLRERGIAGVNVSLASLKPAAAQELAIRLIHQLLPTWLTQEKESDVLTVASWFTTQPQVLPFLVPFIEGVLQQTRSQQEAERALALVRHVPRRLTMLAPLLLDEDASWITFPTISGYLLRRRHELLTPFLALQPVAGRWGTGRKRFVLPITRPLAWSTARQQETLADALSAVALDEAQDSRAATQAVKMLAFLPAIGAGRLEYLAEHPQSVIRTTALFTLGHLDTDDGFPILLQALQDARARIAIHVVRGRLLAMPTEEALAILRTIGLERVTVAKEVVRLVGDLPGEAAYQELLALERRDDLHRDVRAALLRALSNYLEQAETWEALERAARLPEPEVALAALPPRALQGAGIPAARELTNRPGETIAAHLLRWLAVLLEHPQQTVWLRAVNYAAQQAPHDTGRVLIPRLLALLRVPGKHGKAEAAQALLLVSGASDASLITQALELLLPQRGLLSNVLQRLRYSATASSGRLLAVMRVVLRVLARDPKTVALQLNSALRFLPAAEFPARFARLAQSGQLHADALAAACALLATDPYRHTSGQLEKLEASLAASDDERLRRLALAALQGQARKSNNGWTPAMLERLRAYRADRSLLVASAAEFTFAPEEDEEEDDDDDDFDDE